MTVTYLQIEPTTRCNFSCGFCGGRHAEQGDLADGVLDATLAHFPEIEYVELSGLGEPLLFPGFIDALSALRARDKRVFLITNGSLLTENLAEGIVARGVEQVLVSIESPDPDHFRRIRGGELSKVLDGIATVQMARRAQGSRRPAIGFAITVLADTSHELNAILDLYVRLGLDGGVSMQPLISKNDFVSSYDMAVQAQTLDADAVNDVWLKYLSHARIRRINRQSGVCGFYDDLFSSWIPSSRRCPWLDHGLYVCRDGTVLPCCWLKDQTHALGRIGTGDCGLARREVIRRELASGATPAPCTGCDIAYFATISKFELLRWVGRGINRWCRSLAGS